MSGRGSADSSERDEDFESGNAPGATPHRTPLNFRLVTGMPAPPGQMVQDLAGWQAQQRDQDMMDQSSSASSQLPTSGTVQPGEIDNKREQIWQKFVKANPKIKQADESQGEKMAVEDDETPYMAPQLQNFPFNSIEELAEDMRHNGLRWRHNLRERVGDDPKLTRLLDWVAYRPSPASEPTRSLVEDPFRPPATSPRSGPANHGHERRLCSNASRLLRTPRIPYRVSEGIPREKDAQRGVRRRGRMRVSILVLHAAHVITPNPQRGRHPAPQSSSSPSRSEFSNPAKWWYT
jgi:hypothetical protein